MQRWHKPLIMGVLNVTPDSFSDGGRFLKTDQACKHAEVMIQQGADIIDIGGESTRPGAEPVSVDEELSRVMPVIERLVQETDICLSIDTSKPRVMKEAVAAGAGMINDVYALRQKNALDTAAQLSVPICLMHMQGQPIDMQNAPCYSNGIIGELCHFFDERITACHLAGIAKERLILDPGFGFGKSVTHNLELLKQMEGFFHYNLPILLGVSRKSTLGSLLAKNIDERVIAGVAVAVYAALKGVGIIRTHDIDETTQALAIINAINNIESTSNEAF